MTCARRILVGLVGVLLSGCVSGGLAALDEGPSVTRAQVSEPSAPLPQVPETGGKPKVSLPAPPPAQSNLLPAPSPLQPLQAPLDIQQTTALLDGSKICVRVRAWVNGRPIFEDELMHSAGQELIQVDGLREPQRSEKIAEIFDKVLDHMIDQEVMYQDAVKKLEKGNPKALGKLREVVDQEYEKRMKKIRELSEDKIKAERHIKQFGYIFHRIMERDMISMQYAHSMIGGNVEARVTLETIEEYYKDHPTEFTVKDRVEWQDVFIAVGPKHPTLAEARRFAEQLLARCRTPDDFAKIQAYDDGDSKLRGGAGLGQRQGEIQPAALEPYLFALKEGQIGPVVEIGTGVHLYRVLKRDYAGVRPMDAQVQRTIRRQLEAKIVEREYKQLARRMRARAVVQVVRDLP